MDLIARRDGHEEQVRVRRLAHGYEVQVGDRLYQVDVVVTGAGVHSLLIDNGQYEVSVHRRGAGRYWVSGVEASCVVEVMDRLTHLARATREAAGGRGPERVTALMPGRVVAVLAQEGDELEAGQGVIVVEAMKMENEIRVERPGIVSRILVQEGQAVEGGEPLFEIE